MITISGRPNIDDILAVSILSNAPHQHKQPTAYHNLKTSANMWLLPFALPVFLCINIILKSYFADKNTLYSSYTLLAFQCRFVSVYEVCCWRINFLAFCCTAAASVDMCGSKSIATYMVVVCATRATTQISTKRFTGSFSNGRRSEHVYCI